VLTLDKRRHDPHAPHRYGATAVYDLELTRKETPKAADAEPEVSAGSITIDNNHNN